MSDVTRILSAIEQGAPDSTEQLLPLVHDEFPSQTLQATAFVHEAYIRLVGRDEAGMPVRESTRLVMLEANEFSNSGMRISERSS